MCVFVLCGCIMLPFRFDKVNPIQLYLFMSTKDAEVTELPGGSIMGAINSSKTSEGEPE